MFTIQYQAVDGTHKMQTLDSNSRVRLTTHLAQFCRPIVAVYESASPITKQMRTELRRWPGSMSQYARDFSTSPR